MSASASIVPLLQTPFSAIPLGEKHLREALLPIPDISACPEELVEVCAVHGWPPALYPIIKTSDEWKALGGLSNSEVPGWDERDRRWNYIALQQIGRCPYIGMKGDRTFMCLACEQPAEVAHMNTKKHRNAVWELSLIHI